MLWKRCIVRPLTESKKGVNKVTDVVKDMLKDIDLKQFIKSDLEKFCENEEIAKVIIVALNKSFNNEKMTVEEIVRKR